MRWVSSFPKFVLVSGAFLAGLLIGQVVPPVWKLTLISAAEGAYQEVTYRCDRAMREHLIAKQAVFTQPGAGTVDELQSAEMGLLDCQDYDMMRKRLILWGLNENDLSLMALRAIEARDRDLQEVIEVHEIRY